MVISQGAWTDNFTEKRLSRLLRQWSLIGA